jgi:hypothetical protein
VCVSVFIVKMAFPFPVSPESSSFVLRVCVLRPVSIYRTPNNR